MLTSCIAIDIIIAIRVFCVGHVKKNVTSCMLIIHSLCIYIECILKLLN